MSDSKLHLIARLLAKAESTTPEEAEALTEAAERLMIKHGIEQAHLDECRRRDGPPTEQIVQEQVRFSGAYARDVRELGASVALALGTVQPLYSAGAGSVALHLVGFSSDVEQVKSLIASLQVQAMIAMRSWWLRHRDEYRWSPDRDRCRARSGFIRGFAHGATQRIRDARHEVVAEAAPGTDLVLAFRKEHVDAAAERLAHGQARRRRGADRAAFVEGKRSGQRADTGGPALRTH